MNPYVCRTGGWKESYVGYLEVYFQGRLYPNQQLANQGFICGI